MNYLTGALLTATLFTASLVHAELKYIAYDLDPNILDSKRAETVTVTEADLRSEKYRTGSKMLFVQDTDVSDEYYIGVFEVTIAQANKLGWTKATDSGVAYAMTSSEAANFNPSFSDFPSLSFPRVDQWQAYAVVPSETIEKKACNIGWSDWQGSFPHSIGYWYDYLIGTHSADEYNAYIAPNSHGVFDIFGNVAEYIPDEYIPEKKQFYGGFASATCTTVTLDTCHSASEEVFENNPFLGARLIYTPPEEVLYSFTVTLNGETTTEASYKADTTVTVPVPDFPDGHRETSKTVEPTDLVIADNNTFTMPAANVTITYTTAPYLTIQVKGGTIDGTATKLEIIQGENTTFTLRPTLAAFQVFESWTLPNGDTCTDSELTIDADELFTKDNAGKTLTYTVNTSTVFGSYPRVRVYNGTVTVKTGEAYGEGYYKPGTVLTITAPEKIAGATFSTWQKDGVADGTLTATFIYTVKDTTDDTTFSPVYTFDTPTENAAVTYIGETGESPDSYTAKVELGYKAVSGSTEHAIGVNKFHYYATAYEESDYLVLDIANKTFTYAGSEPTETSQTTTPTLKRVVAETVQSTPYYVGLYETTIAHVANLAKAVDPDANVKTTDLSNTYPQICKSGDTATIHEDYFDAINKHLGLTATLPTVNQICGISNEYKTGATTSSKLQETSILHSEYLTDEDRNGLTNANDYKHVGSKGVDAYGFYDILGNVQDMFADGYLRGGGIDKQLTFCKLDSAITEFPSSNIPGAFRPVISVREKYKVTIEGLTLEPPLTVLPGQVINLAPQVAEGKTFVGWTATKEGETEAVTISKAADADVYPYPVESHVTLTPVFTDKTITLTYSETCRGPETALPGSSTQIYATNPGHALTDITLDPADAGTVDLTTGTITFDADATGAVTVTATYADSSKPGYILKLK